MPGDRIGDGFGSHLRHVTRGATVLTSTFDPHALDWSRHRLGAHLRELGPGLLLADVVPLVGPALLEAWSGRETEDVTLPEPPALEIPPPHEAFDGWGEPVPAVHAASGPAVRRALRWHLQSSSVQQSRFDDAPSVGTITGITSLRLVEDDAGPRDELSQADWDDAYLAVVGQREFRSWASAALGHVAAAFVEMAATGSIRLLARPLIGGQALEIDTFLWHTGPELRLRRLAASGISLAAPFDPSAAIDRLIFVEAEDLVASVKAYGKAHWIGFEPTSIEWPNRTSAAERRNTAVIDAKIRQELTRVLLLPENQFWRLPQAQNHIRRHRDPQLGLGNDANVARVCRELIQETANGGPQYASLGLSGRPRYGLELVRQR